MPWPVLRHWWLCGRKRPYSTRTVAELALDAAFVALRGNAEPLSAFECQLSDPPDAPHWHVGHKQMTRHHSARRDTRDAQRAWNRWVDATPRHRSTEPTRTTPM